MLQGKKIILGITGSIAAYKAAYLTRLLVKNGAEVKVIMTPYAAEFITPVTLATLSNNSVLIDFFKHDDGSWNSHVDLGIWADVMLIAPATANTLAKMAHGVCDNLLLTTYLSARCPVVVAPAMDLDMFAHPATRRNQSVLIQDGCHFIEPAVGDLASGLEGKGRMEEPEKIVEQLAGLLKKKGRFEGKHLLVTAGPTYENLDPVRYIGNYSTGKMGFALVRALINEGARLTLIHGPVDQSVRESVPRDHAHLVTIPVQSADEMYQEATQVFSQVDGAILTAAVSDYRPEKQAREKTKRGSGEITMKLVPNPDIAAELGRRKQPGQFLVGFALETDSGLDEARRKKERKNLDMIVLNSLRDPGAGFGGDTNRITLIGMDNNPVKYELKTKDAVAGDILDALYVQLNQS